MMDVLNELEEIIRGKYIEIRITPGISKEVLKNRISSSSK
jgi:hypothetical protein